MRPLATCRLYTFVDTAYLAGRPAADVARALCEGGSDIVQLRGKGLPLDALRRLALEVLPVTRAHDVPLVINDYPALAAEVGAAFCHVGQEDFFGAGHHQVAELRPPAAPGLRVGLSTHAPEQAVRALAAGPDYIAIGPVFATPTKPGRPAVTLDYVRWAAAQVTIPWFAIGGITLANLDAVLGAGATRICVVSAILQARDIAQACREFKSRLPSAPRDG